MKRGGDGEMKYFVMAINFRNHPEPIVNDDDNLTLFDTEKEADEMANGQPLCHAGGYEIYEWPYL